MSLKTVAIWIKKKQLSEYLVQKFKKIAIVNFEDYVYLRVLIFLKKIFCTLIMHIALISFLAIQGFFIQTFIETWSS